MLISVRDRVELEQRLGLLDNRRVLVAGPSSELTDALCDAFRQRGSRLVSIASDLPACDAVQVASADCEQQDSAEAIRVSTLTHLRPAFTKHGGLDIVVNVIAAQMPSSGVFGTKQDTERQLSVQFQAATAITQIAASRMALTRTEGIILSILDYNPNTDRRARAQSMMARNLLQSMTRRQATAWSSKGVCINAIAPHIELNDTVSGDALEPRDLSDIALYLASSRAPQISGLTFAPEDVTADIL